MNPTALQILRAALDSIGDMNAGKNPTLASVTRALEACAETARAALEAAAKAPVPKAKCAYCTNDFDLITVCTWCWDRQGG